MAATGTLTPAKVNLTAVVGADFSTTIALFTDLAQTVPFDLTGYTATFTIGTVFTLTIGVGLTIATPANGQIVAALTHTQTAAITPTDTAGYHYSLKLTDGSGTISYPLNGQMVFAGP